MKNLMLFTVLIGLGFTGGSLFPNIMADAENSKAEENCNCGCGPTEVKLMMVPTGSDMLLTTNLIEAISNDADNSLTSEELVTIINEVQKESSELSNQTAVMGTSIGAPESEIKTTVNSYEEIISRFLSSSVSTTEESTQDESELESEPMAVQSSLQSGVIIKDDEITTESSQTKKTKNNNGLGNGSEEADGTSTDVKGIDPSNPGNGQKNSQKSVKETSSHTKVNTTTKSSGKTGSSKTTNNSSSNKATSNASTKSTKQSSNKSQQSKDKVKNNNGLGNGSEPADGTTSDIKGIDPSNPGNGGSKNNAGK